ncbi:MAG: hypothetical protein QOI76_3012 [Frankiales bacterium]|jgi:hypothetical protein|nr:hypothetical protein [Frankiales bacterium]
MHRRWAHGWAAALALTGTGVLAGCGGAGTTTWYGAVTSLEPQLCVGRHAATGGCFSVTTAASVASVLPGQCVELTFRPSSSPGRPRLLTMHPVHAADHRTDCPNN